MTFQSCPDLLFSAECRTLSLSMVPLFFYLAGLVLLLGVNVWSLIQLWQTETRRWAPGILFFGVVLFFLFGLTGAALIAVEVETAGRLAHPFRGLRIGAILAGAGALTAGASALAIAVIGKVTVGGWIGRVLLCVLGIGCAGLLGMELVPLHAEENPILGFTHPDWVHEGEAVPIEIHAPDSWKTFSTKVQGLSAGQHAIKYSYTRGPWSIYTKSSLSVAQPVASEHFPLRVGNAWTWSMTSRTGATSGTFWTLKPRGSVAKDLNARQLEILEKELVDGKIRFKAQLRQPESDPMNFYLIPKNGETLFQEDEKSSPISAVKVYDHDGENLVVDRYTCEFKPLGLTKCTCAGKTGGPTGVPPGPLKCFFSSNNKTGRSVARGIIGFLSVGLVDIGNPSTRRDLYLEHFTPGSIEAPGVAPQWQKTKDALYRCYTKGGTKRSRTTRKRDLARCTKGTEPVDLQVAALILDDFETDIHRLEVLEALAPKITDPGKEALTRLFVDPDERLRAKALLFPELNLQVPKRDPVLLCYRTKTESARFDKHRLKALRSCSSRKESILLRSAPKILKSFSFDKYRLQALELILPKLEEIDMKVLVETFKFRDEKTLAEEMIRKHQPNEMSTVP